jgi:hypothetical protein
MTESIFATAICSLALLSVVLNLLNHAGVLS